MSPELDIVQRINLMRELGRRLLVYLDAVADLLPADLVVDTLLMVAATRGKVATRPAEDAE